MTPKQDYARKLNTIAARYGRLEEETIHRSIAMLRDLRAQIAGELTAVRDYRAFSRRELSASLEHHVARFEAELAAQTRDAFSQAMLTGGEAVTGPLQALGVEGAFFTPSRAQINVVLDFSADLVKGITEDVRNKINTRIRLAALGQQSPLEAMRGITDDLGTARRKGVVKGVSAKAETVLRTEMNRAYNLAHHSQQIEAEKMIPGLLKRWIATADARTRPTHLRAHFYYKDHPIPIDQPFKVGTAKLMFPGDPNGPAEETIHCR